MHAMCQYGCLVFFTWISLSAATCGGHLAGSNVTILSPNYPSNYDPNANCSWVISGPTGHYLTLTFNNFSLESSYNCSNDFVVVREFNKSGEVLLWPSCGDTIPTAVNTSDSVAFVLFMSNGYFQASGFSLTFQANVEECGGNLTTITGTIASPNYPGLYAHSQVCVWRITVPTGRRVKLIFNDFSLEGTSTSHCYSDYVEITDEMFNGTQVSKGRYCGSTVPPVVVSSTSRLLVTFHSDGATSAAGFAANWNTTCGGILDSPQGELTSPNYPNNYHHDEFCVWKIVAPSGQRIRLQFTDFSLENHVTCRWDYLELFNGEMLLGRFCGQNVTSFLSQSNAIRIVFKTVNNSTARGFRATYYFDSKGCGGMYHSNTGNISSPNYPNNYPANTECVWNINVLPGYTVVFSVSALTLQNTADCGSDYLEITDVMSNGTQVSKGRYCGSTVPPVVVSSTRRLLVTFHSDGATSAAGFAANWTSSCGGMFTDEYGEIVSPGYPRAYTNNLRCNYTILGEPQNYVTLSFDYSTYGLEVDHSNCQFDFIQIVAGNSPSGYQLGKFCGSTVPGPVHAIGALHIRFWTDGSVVRPGFKARYRIEDCGGVFTYPYGHIRTPTYPISYAHNSNCTWTITLTNTNIVALRFLSFDVASHSGCQYNYVAVYDGDSISSSNLIGRYCGSRVPSLITSRTNKMLINFITDASVVNGGFSAGYWATYGNQQGCGGVINSTSGVLRSFDADGDGLYENNLNCGWTFFAGDGKVITFSLTGLNITQEGPNCTYDFVAIYDGPSTNDPLLGKYCGDDTPPPAVATSTNAAYVVFHTDGSVVRPGFNMTYTQQDCKQNGCGGVIKATTCILQSFDADGNGLYENNLNCNWTFFADDGKVITFNLTGLNIERGRSNCIYDYVAIYDGPSTDDPLLGKYCGNDTPPAFTTSTNAAYVVFHTDGSVVRPGFNMTYTQQDSVCGGSLNATQTAQNLTSPGYPGTYGQDLRCRWTIDSGTQSEQVSLTLTDLDLAYQSNCTGEYIEFKDSPLGDNGRSIYYCGTQLPPTFDTIGRVAQVNYVLSSGSIGRGFRLSYAWAVCGGTFTEEQGEIVTPGYPTAYINNLRCNYTILGEPQHYVMLSFDNSTYGLEEDHSNCQFDFIQIFAGNSSSGTQLGKFCGSTVPDPVHALGALHVQFWTNGSGVGPGFKARYRIEKCGGVFTQPYGHIRTPTNPIFYANNSNCTWTITLNNTNIVTLRFLSFDVASGSGCLYNYVAVYDGDSISSYNLIRWYCGSRVPSLITSRTNKMLVNFITNASDVTGGFTADYWATYGEQQGCGGVINSTSGVLRSFDADGDGLYENNLNCGWTFFAGDGKVITFTLTGLNITQEGPNCTYDFVAIYDGPSTDDPLLGKYCGDDTPPPAVATSTNAAYVVFHTDSTIVKPGFNMTYTQQDCKQNGCGGVINVTTCILQSFDVDGNGLYENNLNCNWTFFADDDKVITFNLTGLNIERGGPDCPYDYVAIYDGPSTDDPLLGKYCGDDTPPPAFTTSTNAAYVVFHTDGSIVKPGFNMTYTQQDSVCGGSLNATQEAQNLTSPGYPSAYGQDIRCRWTIESHTWSKQVSLTLTDLDLANQTSCTGEYIEFRDSALGDNGRSIYYCGTQLPQTFDTIGQVAQVNYVLSSGSIGRGFRLSYAWADCNKQYSGTSGRITSPRYRGMYWRAVQCNSTVTAPAGYTLAFYFTRFFRPTYSSCSLEYLAISNDTDSSSSEVARLCGGEIPDPVFLSSNTASLSFIGSYYFQRMEYDITYVATSSGVLGCGGDIQAGIKGSLTSPNFPGNFTSEDTTTCTWTITVPARRQLTLNFTDLDVPGEANFAHDCVEVFNGPTVFSPPFRKLCTSMPTTLQASGNTATVKMTSTASSPAPSFRMVYYS